MLNLKLNYNKIFWLLALCALVAFPFSLARADLIQLYFGGPITEATSFWDCSCSFGTFMHVDNPAPLDIFMPWSLLNDVVNVTSVYEYGKVDKGQTVLGDSWRIHLTCLQLQPAPPPIFVKCQPNDGAKPNNGYLIHAIGTTDK